MSLPETDTVTLYLWKNRRTVVIGQNQNPYSEVNLDALLSDGGYLMRRRTGGGAVYHDDGNINFSFIAPKSLYDQQRQFAVLKHAVADFGIEAEVSGRNDVTTGGRKFSGNAFSRGRYQDLHHGTILIRSNMADLQRYLKPKPAKLLKHGVSSVQSRVVNLSELNSSISSESIVPHLKAAFAEVYGCTSMTEMDYDELLLNPEVKVLHDQFASDEWLYGRWQTFTAQRTAQFEWGGVELALTVEKGMISDVQIASDALDLQSIEQARTLLLGASAIVPPATSDNPIITDIMSIVY